LSKKKGFIYLVQCPEALTLQGVVSGKANLQKPMA
jgi:hypothetical protein